ncbi:helix-turn-helix domain-containing protein [Paenibacillus whitsoniae]|nr:helix-turn-helix domain-containing protein [Paenibacillus whitsoniae]
MYKVLIIDDEEWIGQGVKAKLERANVGGVTQIEVAGGGLQGMEMALNLQPHVIITDIRMPDVDGIQVIQELSKSLPRTKFIMLSGYGDYPYVREAFKYGAQDYLLKPAASDELGKQVETAIAGIELDQLEDRLANQNRTDAKALLAARLPLFIHGAKRNRHEAAEPSSAQEAASGVKRSDSLLSLETYFEHPNFVMAMLSFGDMTFSEEHLESVQDCMQSLVDAEEMEAHLRHIAFHDRQGDVCLVFNYTATALSLETLVNLLSQTVAMLRKGKDKSPVASVSQTGRGIDDLPRLYKQAQQAMSERILRQSCDVIQTIVPPGQTGTWLPAKKEVEELKQAAESLYVEQIHAWVDRHLRDELRPKMSLEQLKAIYDVVLSEIHRHVHDRFLLDEGERAAAFNTFHTLDELRHYLKSYATDTKQLISEQSALGDTVITVAEAIVREHYNRDLQLAEVANRVSMNYSYFSKLFKERTGLTFTAYLIKVRMEEAKRLLKDPILRINEISEKVGYGNLYHFSRAFKNYFGISPKEYRKTL